MRESTRGRVLNELLRSRPSSRKQIAETTQISPATVSRVVDQLISDGLVTEGDEVVVDTRGRRQVLLDVVPDISLALGIDVGASRTRVVLTDLTAKPLACADVATPVESSSEALAEWIGVLARQTAAQVWPTVRAVALGLPGAVNRHSRSVSNAPNLPQVQEPKFVDACETALGLQLACDNDANYALLGEQHFGAAAGLGSAAMVTLGAGLGVGLSVDGRLVRGSRGLVGEFGQLPVGPLGASLESMVTGPGIMRLAADVGLALGEPADLFRMTEDRATKGLRSGFDQALVVALVAVAVSCDPDAIVLGGGIAKSLRTELDDYQRELSTILHTAPRLVYTELGDFAGAAGAVVAALHLLYLDLGVSPGDLVGVPGAATLNLESLSTVALSLSV